LPPCVVLRAGRALPLDLPDGTVLTAALDDGTLHDLPVCDEPPAVPYGNHVLRAVAPDGRSAWAPLIVAPERIDGPGCTYGTQAPRRTYGFMVQLYSVLTSRSWGMGDLADLADLASWAGRTLGAGFLAVNPLHSALVTSRP